jgi:hypothetical protein
MPTNSAVADVAGEQQDLGDQIVAFERFARLAAWL